MSANGTHIEATRIIGGPQTGKTSLLVNRAASLVRLALDPNERVLLLVAAPACVHATRRLLGDCLAGASCNVRVATPRELALEILSLPGVAASFGRTARLVEPFEERFLMEDMRASQMKGRRIGAITAFVRRGLSELADDDPSWIQTVEEHMILERMRSNLEFTGGILDCELAGFALRALRADESLAEHMRHDHVLVDDYGALERASQLLACMLARHSITVAGEEGQSARVFESYPFAGGMAEFASMHPQAQTIELTRSYANASIAEVADRVRREEELGRGSETSQPANAQPLPYAQPPTEGVYAYMGDSMGDELRAICVEVRTCLEAGGTAMVVGTNGVWRANVARALASADIAVLQPRRPTMFGDFRDQGTCARAVDETLARLAADPSDGVAWRCAVGFGDYMARSVAVDQLRIIAQPQGIGLAQALAALECGGLEGADPSAPMLASLVQTYRQVRGQLACPIDGTPTPSSSADHATVGAPVTACSPREAFGSQADLVVFGGFVNGFIPSRDYLDPTALAGTKREQARLDDLRALRLVLGRARRRFVCTGFTQASLEVAERLGLHIARIRLKDGIRSCLIEPSELLGIVMPRPSPS